MNNPNMMIFLSYGFGFITVWFFCIRFFNEPLYSIVEVKGDVLDQDHLLDPVSPRLMTNRYRYRFYLFLFIVITEVLYILLAELLPQFLGQKDMGRTYNAFASALILTGFLPNLEFVRRYLDMLKELLHRKAQIPEEGRDLYYHIKRGQIKYSRQVVDMLLKDPEYGKELDPSFFRLGKRKKTMAERWAWLAYIHYYVNVWSRRPECQILGRMERDHWGHLRQSFFSLQKNLILYNQRRLDRTTSQETTKLLTLLTLRTCIQLTGILLCHKSRSRPINICLKGIGYDPYFKDVFAPSMRQFSILFLALSLSIIIGGFLLWPAAFVLHWIGLPVIFPSFHEVPKWMFFGLPIHLVAVVIVLLLKQYFTTAGNIWPMVTRKNSYSGILDRPWHLYLMGMALSYAGSLATLALLYVINQKDYALVDLITARPYGIMAPWALIGVVTAGFLAFRIDSVNHDISTRQMVSSAIGAIFQGTVTSGMVWIASLIASAPPTRDDLISYLITGFITGSTIYSFSRFNASNPEKRRYKRFKTSPLKLDIEAAPEKGIGELINISKRGALLKSEFRVSFGRIMNLIAGENFQIRGEVVRNENGLIALHFKNSDFWNKFYGCIQP